MSVGTSSHGRKRTVTRHMSKLGSGRMTLNGHELQRVVVLTGAEGVGKSATGNLLAGKPHDAGPFRAADGLTAVTTACESWTDEGSSGFGYELRIVDTPGLSRGMLGGLKEVASGGVDLFLLIASHRDLARSFLEVLRMFQFFFGLPALDRTLLVVTDCRKWLLGDQG